MHRIVGVLEVHQLPGASGTGLATCGGESLGDAVVAERALRGRLRLWIQEAATVRAGLDAVRQPRQYFWSTSTTPSGETNVAPTGHTCVQGESAQWLHNLGTKKFLPPSLVEGGKPCLPPSGESTWGFSMDQSATW